MLKDVRESGFFVRSKTAENKIDVTEFLANGGGVGAEAESGELIGFEMLRDRFEAVIAASRAAGAEAEFAEGEVEVVADDEGICG